MVPVPVLATFVLTFAEVMPSHGSNSAANLEMRLEEEGLERLKSWSAWDCFSGCGGSSEDIENFLWCFSFKKIGWGERNLEEVERCRVGERKPQPCKQSGNSGGLAVGHEYLKCVNLKTHHSWSLDDNIEIFFTMC